MIDEAPDTELDERILKHYIDHGLDPRPYTPIIILLVGILAELRVIRDHIIKLEARRP